MHRELKRLVNREGFRIDAGNWENRDVLRKNIFPGCQS